VEAVDPDEGDEAGADDVYVLADADEDIDADAEADADADADVDVDADADVDVDVVGVGDVVGVAEVGVVVGCVVGDEYVLAGVGWDVLVDGAGLAGEDGEADGEVEAKPSGFADPDAGAVAGDVCAAGCSIWTGVWLMEFTTKAVAPPAPTMPPRINASTSGFVRRRRGG
jgi:hypothetical protein